MDEGPPASRMLRFLIFTFLIALAQAKSVELTESERQLKDAERAWVEDTVARNAAALKKESQHKDRVLGKPGVNYHYNGTNPYLTCNYFNRTECNPDVRSDCPTTKQCYLDGSHRQMSCLGIFQYSLQEPNNTDKTTKHFPVEKKNIIYLGCFNIMADVPEPYCEESQCRATSKRTVPGRAREPDRMKRSQTEHEVDTDKIGYGFCCCHKDNCNHENGLERMNPNFEETGQYKIKPIASNSDGEKHVNFDELYDQMVNDSQGRNPIRITTVTSEEITTVISNTAKVSEDELSIVWILMGVLGILLFLFIVVCLFLLLRRLKRGRGIHQDCIQLTDRFHSIPTTNNTSDRSSSRNWRNATSPTSPSHNSSDEEKQNLIIDLPVSDLKLIDRGRFGVVCRGIYTNEDGTTNYVAVKKFKKEEKVSFDSEKTIFEELLQLNRWYPSILRYINSIEVGDEYWLITEYHERFSLCDLIKKNVISFASAVRIIVTMLDGLQFLHDERPFFFDVLKPMIIHRDIKSRNILVKSDMTTCIGDFGLARKYDLSNLTGLNGLLAQVGTKRYMSPEVLEGATEYNSAAFKQMDVYGMALVMWEVLSRTQLDETDEVEEYKLPYQKELGFNPKIPQLANLVHTKQTRPIWRDRINTHPLARELKNITEEMWCPLAGNRITAGCAFDRVWNSCLIKAAEQPAEGEPIDNDAVQEMVLVHPGLIKYHKDPTNYPHPSDDPFLVRPYPPPPPDMPEEEPHSNEGGSSSKHQYKQAHFSLKNNEFCDYGSEDPLHRKRKPSTSSTTTPEWSD